MSGSCSLGRGTSAEAKAAASTNSGGGPCSGVSEKAPAAAATGSVGGTCSGISTGAPASASTCGTSPTAVKRGREQSTVGGPVERLHAWAATQSLQPHQVQDLVRLLDPVHLRSLPVRRKSRAWPRSPVANNYRHHFYRQVAHLLGWVEQKAFEEEFTDIVRSVWPDKQDGETQIVKTSKRGRQM